MEDHGAKLQLFFLQWSKRLSSSHEPTRATCQSLHDLVELVCHLMTTTTSSEPSSRWQRRQQVLSEFADSFPPASYTADDIRRSLSQPALFSFVFSEIVSHLEHAQLDFKTVVKQALPGLIDVAHNYAAIFDILHDYCCNLKPSRHRDICLHLMKQFVSKRLVKRLFMEMNECRSENGSNTSTIIENPLIQKVVNLPDKLASTLMHSANDSFKSIKSNFQVFMPKNYMRLVCTDLWQCSRELISKSSSTSSYSLQFVANVLGKIGFLGYSEILFTSYMCNCVAICYNEPTQSRPFVDNLLASMTPRYLESFLVNLITNASCHQDVSVVLGDLIVKHHELKYLLVDKFLFLRVLLKESAIQNLIGYLCESGTRRPLYIDVFKKLLASWSSQSAIVNTPYEQHLYLTKCLLVCIAFMESSDKTCLATDLMGDLLRGVEKHLRSPIDKLRVLGMIVGENLMNDLTPFGCSDQSPTSADESKQLKFEYMKSEEVLALQALRNRPNKESTLKGTTSAASADQDLLSDLDGTGVRLSTASDANKSVSPRLVENTHLKVKITMNSPDSDDDEDDDDDDEDDLVPYDLSNDVPLSNAKQPAYLRDCLDALIYSDDPEKVEHSLKAVEKLCNTYHFELAEICVELLKVLLNKTNPLGIDDYDEIRANAMISVTIHYPKESAEYLTSQFYEAGYTLHQRTDILHVLVMSIQKLSSPKEAPIFDQRVFFRNQQQLRTNSAANLLAFNAKSTTTSNNWKEVVAKRIEAKTRIKKTNRASTSAPKTKENTFSDTYGYFFFPLLNAYDMKRVHLNIIEQDFMLLGKLVFSLAVILYSSVNTNVVENMTCALVDFMWSLRNHVEPFVRQSILFAFTLTLLDISSDLLFGKLNNYLIELKYWLEMTIANDPSVECQKGAVDCLTLLGKRIKEHFAVKSAD